MALKSLKDELKNILGDNVGFLMFLGIAASIAYGLNTAASDMKTRSCKGELAKENYSLNQFETILRLHRVKRIEMDKGKFVLPRGQYQRCLNWIEKQPLTDETDIQEFIDHYNSVRQQELDDLYEYWDQEYDKNYDDYLCTRSDEDGLFLFQKEHNFLYKDEQIDLIRNRITDLYRDTFWSELCVKPGKLVKDETSSIETWLEIWVDKCPGGLEKAEEYYKACNNILYFVDE